jgi:PAS domain S-box-containing protein
MKSTAKKVESSIVRTLKDSELRYRRLFEATQDGILILDAKTGMIEDVNPYLIRMLGYSREEFVEKKLWEVGAFKDIEASKDAFEALQENEYIRYEDLPLKTKSGKLIQVEFVSNVYLVGDEKVIQCNIRDITEHKRIIVALQENEKKYYDLVNQSPEGVFIFELSGHILTVNKAMCRELAFSEEEFLSMSIWDIIPEQYLDPYRKSLTKILEGKSLEEAAEYKLCGKDGKIHYVEVLSAPRYSGKDIVGFQGIARDITERKQAEDVLRTSEERFKTIFEQAPLGIALIDSLTGHIYEVNPRFAKIAGRAMEEMTNIDWMQITHPDDVQADLDNMALLNAGKINGFQMEKRYLHPDGTAVWINMTIAPMKVEDKAQPRHLCMIEDITDRKQAEERIKRQLEHLTALSGIDRVISANFDLKLSLSEILSHLTIERTCLACQSELR